MENLFFLSVLFPYVFKQAFCVVQIIYSHIIFNFSLDFQIIVIQFPIFKIIFLTLLDFELFFSFHFQLNLLLANFCCVFKGCNTSQLIPTHSIDLPKHFVVINSVQIRLSAQRDLQCIYLKRVRLHQFCASVTLPIHIFPIIFVTLY